MKYISVCFFYFFLNGALSQVNSIQEEINVFVNSPDFQTAGISFEARDVVTGEVLGTYNPQMAMAPASTVKLFTTASSFLTLGADYQPLTRFYVDGYIDSAGIVQGNLFVRGGGDPSLGSRFFEKRETRADFLKKWAEELAYLGVKKINGSVIADGSDFGYHGAPDGWTWSDMGNYYGSGPSGCTVFDNMVYLLFNTGDEVGEATKLACTDPYIPNFELDNYVSTSKTRRDNSYVYGAPYLEERFITGSLPLKKENFEVKASIPDPEYLLAVEFDYVLQESGIPTSHAPEGYRIFRKSYVSDTRYTQPPIYTYKGKTVSSIAYHTNMRSVNLFAEQLLCLIGWEKKQMGTTDKGVQYLTRFWSDIVGAGFRITDGSGLSRSNAISSSHYTKMLTYMTKSTVSEEFENTLPVAGESGTLARVCKGQAAQGRLLAKSGTMSLIKSYAGYVNSKSGKKIAFAIIVNNYTGSTANVVKRMEKVFNAMASY